MDEVERRWRFKKVGKVSVMGEYGTRVRKQADCFEKNDFRYAADSSMRIRPECRDSKE